MLQLAYLEIGPTIQDRLGAGLMVSAVGMTVCFIVLTFLYYIFMLVGRAGASEGGSGRGKPREQRVATEHAVAEPEKSAPALEAEAVAPQHVEAMPVSHASQLGVVAAIAAVLATVTASAPVAVAGGGSHAVSRNAWSLAGRIHLMEGRVSMPRGQR